MRQNVADLLLHLDERRTGAGLIRTGGLATLLQELHLGQHLKGLGQQALRLLHVGLFGREGCELLVARGDRGAQSIGVLSDVLLQGSNLGLQLADLGGGLLNEGVQLLDPSLGLLDGRGLLLLVCLAPAHVLVVRGEVLRRLLVDDHLHLFDQRDHLSDGAHLRGDRGGGLLPDGDELAGACQAHAAHQDQAEHRLLEVCHLHRSHKQGLQWD
mmetsp:Transcript_98567/g.317835  ORF Transcript_98567/g.317835 Transcript_98567/m.317835 type:complete len:213 (+) Transcript_98567:1653-2291(+)